MCPAAKPTPTAVLEGNPSRAWAIVPAAGTSSRMGLPKLLLPWQGRPLIGHVIAAFQQAGVADVVVVVRSSDKELAALCRDLKATVVIPAEPPAQMKDSVRLGLEHVAAQYQPRPGDHWLLSPADLPKLSQEVIAKLLLAAQQHCEAILTPQHVGRRGHPTLFPWRLAEEVTRLKADEGINALLLRHAVVEVACGPACLEADIDTPDEYRRLQT